MEQGTQLAASFTGTLLRREHMLGQKFVQLVFREEDRDILCVSTDPKMATLPVGQAYAVEGAFKSRGAHSFVYNPTISLLKKHWRPIRRVVFLGLIIVGFITLGGMAFMLQLPASHTPLTRKNNSVTSTSYTTPQATTNTTPATVTAPAVTTTPATTTTTTIKTKTTATVPTTSKTPSTTTPAPAVAAPTDSCTTQSIPFTDETTDDPTQLVGDSTVTQAGVDGSEQVCAISGTTVTTAMMPQITAVGTMTPPDPAPTD